MEIFASHPAVNSSPRLLGSCYGNVYGYSATKKNLRLGAGFTDIVDGMKK